MTMRIIQSLPSRTSFRAKNIQSPLHSLAWAFLACAAAILPLLLSAVSSSFAGSATWLTNPATGDWNTAANWTAGGPPNGSADTATFASSNIIGISLSGGPFTEVNGIVFNAGGKRVHDHCQSWRGVVHQRRGDDEQLGNRPELCECY